MKFANKKIAAAAMLACLATLASADTRGGYIGIGGGSSVSSVKNTNTGRTDTYSAPTTVLFGGYKFNENIAAEAEYLSAGSFQATGVSLDATGYSLFGVFNKPVGNWAFFGKVGLTSLTSKLSAAPGYVLTVPASETKTGVVFGGGAEYAFTPNAALRLGLTSYEYSAGAGALTGRMAAFTVNGKFSF